MTDALGNNLIVFGTHSLPLQGQAAPWWSHCSLLVAAHWPSAGLPVPAQSLLLLVLWLTNAGLVSLSIKKYPVPAPSQGPSLSRTSPRSSPPPFMYLAFPGMLVQSQGESRLPCQAVPRAVHRSSPGDVHAWRRGSYLSLAPPSLWKLPALQRGSHSSSQHSWKPCGLSQTNQTPSLRLFHQY